jgi:uncharacterized protein involved in propanediol utilization
VKPEDLASCADPRILCGTACAFAHHGELLQGVLRAESGDQVARFLVSLLREDFITVAEVELTDNAEDRVKPSWCQKALRAARLSLRSLGKGDLGIRLTIRSNTPIGVGLGSSTADVVAAIRAVADALRSRVSEEFIATTAVAAETASDPLMFSTRAVAFAQREGRMLRDLGPWFPRFQVVSCVADLSVAQVDTLSRTFPPYSSYELDEFEALLDHMQEAHACRSLSGIATVSTRSAEINNSYYPMSHFAQIRRIAEREGSLGVQISHSGTIAGVLLDPLDPALAEKTAAIIARIEECGAIPCGVFQSYQGLNS